MEADGPWCLGGGGGRFNLVSGRRWRQIDLGVWEEMEADLTWCLGGDGGRFNLVSGRRWRQI